MKIKNTPLLLVLIVSFVVQGQSKLQATGYRLQEESKSAGTTSTVDNRVTAGEYCEFLNAVGASDAFNFYDEKMDCIVRSGIPGSYSYFTAPGAEEKPITYVDLIAAMRYYDWLDNAASIDSSKLQLMRSSPDESHPSGCLWQSIPQLPSCRYCCEVAAGNEATSQLRSNRMTFREEKEESSLIKKDSGKESGTPWKTIEAVAGILGVLTLEDFRQASEAHPTATRFILREEEGHRASIHSQEEDSAALGRNRSENMRFTQALRAALEREHSRETAENLLPHTTSLIDPGLPLSREQFDEILRQSEIIQKRARKESDEEALSRKSDSSLSNASSDDIRPNESIKDLEGLQKHLEITIQETIAQKKDVESQKVMIASRMASRIASRVVAPFDHGFSSDYVAEYIEQYRSEYDKRAGRNTSVRSQDVVTKNDLLLQAQKDALQETEQSEQIPEHRDFLQNVLKIGHNVKKTKAQEIVIYQEAAKDALEDVLNDLSQDQKKAILAGERDYTSSYAADYARHYFERNIENLEGLSEWFSTWAALYRTIILGKEINTPEERDSFASGMTDEETASISSYFSKASASTVHEEENFNSLDEQHQRIAERKKEFFRAREQLVLAVKKIPIWKQTVAVDAEKLQAETFLEETKKETFKTVSAKAEKAWNNYQDALSLDGRMKGVGGLAGKNAKIAEAKKSLETVNQKVRENYLTQVVQKIQEVLETSYSSMEEVLSEIYWKNKEGQKERAHVQFSALPISSLSLTDRLTEKKLGIEADRELLERLWPTSIPIEEERAQRLATLKENLFEQAEEAWSQYTKPEESLEDRAEVEARALEQDARHRYAQAVKEEALAAAQGTHARAAQGAWLVRIKNFIEAVAQAAKEKSALEEATYYAMFLSHAPWCTRDDFRKILHHLENKSFIIPAAELAVTNIPGSELVWAEIVGDFDKTDAHTKKIWRQGKDVDAEHSFYVEKRNAAEATYRNALLKWDRAIAVAEAHVAAWKEARFPEAQKDEEVLSFEQRAQIAQEKSEAALQRARETMGKGMQKVASLWQMVASDLAVAAEHWAQTHKHHDSNNPELAKKSEESATIIEKDVLDLEVYIDSLAHPKKVEPERELCSQEVAGSQVGFTRVIKIIKKNLKYPYVRMEEERDAASKRVGGASMVADHMLVRLGVEVTEEAFLQALDDPNAWLEEVPFSKPLYRLHFLPKDFREDDQQSLSMLLGAMTTLLEKIKNLKEEKKMEVHAEPNFFLTSFSEPDDPLYKDQWNLKGNHGIHMPHDLLDLNISPVPLPASPIVVAVLDSGLRYGSVCGHEDLEAHIWQGENTYKRPVYGYDATVDQNLPAAVRNNPSDDECGHGTFVAGIIGAISNNKRGIAGIAGIPGMVRLMACKVLNDAGSLGKGPDGLSDGIISCINFARLYGAKILNCSWGRKKQSINFPEGFSDQSVQELQQALDNTGKNNPIMAICAAGNDGTDNDKDPVYPASYNLPNVISVAATRRKDGALADELNFGGGSNFGETTVHLTAPGVGILSTALFADEYTDVQGNKYKGYKKNKGTSFAAPQATAALVRLMVKYPNQNFVWYRNKLQKSADPLPANPTYPDRKVAWGKLNLTKALTDDTAQTDNEATSVDDAFQKMSVSSSSSSSSAVSSADTP